MDQSGESRPKTDSPSLQKGLNAFTSSINYIGGTIGNALEVSFLSHLAQVTYMFVVVYYVGRVIVVFFLLFHNIHRTFTIVHMYSQIFPLVTPFVCGLKFHSMGMFKIVFTYDFTQ